MTAPYNNHYQQAPGHIYGAMESAPSYAPSHGSQPESDVENVMQALWEKKLVLIAITIMFTAFAALYAKSIPPKYTAESVLSVDREELLPSAVTQILGFAGSNFEVNTHIEIMRSPNIISRLITDLDLHEDAEFAGDLSANEMYSDAQKQFMLIERVRRAINIRPASSASIITIEVNSIDPVKAAAIANRLSDIFVKEHLDLKYAEVRRVAEWMDSKKNELEAKMTADAKALRDFQAQSGIIGASNILQSHDQEFLQLNSRLLETEEKFANAKTRLQFVRKNMHSSGLYSLDEVLTSTLIASFKQKEMQLEADLAKLQTKFGEKHPEVIAAKTNLDAVRDDLHKEVRSIIKNIENKVTLYERQAKDIQERIADFQEKFKQNRKGQLIKLQELQHDMETSRRFYENFLAVYQQAAPQKIVNDSNVKIISYAQPPVFSSYPNRKMLVMLGLLFGLSVGVFAALVLNKMNKSFRSISDIESFTGFPIYSIIPEIKKTGKKKITRYVLDRPTSKAAESIRSLRMNMVLRAREGENLQIINMTSTHSDEGKSTTSAWLATLCAKAGERVLLIDCDLRRPKQHKNFNLSLTKSLVDYLTDRAALTEIIQKDEASGLDVIACKPSPTHALSLLTSAKMQDMLDELRDEYDLIILDSPAAASLSDPYVLSKLSDRTLYILDYHTADRDDLSNALKRFYDIHYYDIGMVVNKVDFKKAHIVSKNHLAYAYLDEVAYG